MTAPIRACAGGAGAWTATTRRSPGARSRCSPSGSARCRTAVANRWDSTTCGCRSRRCRRRRASSSSRRSAPSTCATTASRASRTPPAAATTTSCGCARAWSTRHPTRSSTRRDAAEVAAVLRACAEEGVAVVPFGGGTSVVGGVEPLRGRFPAVVALDLARLDRLLADGPGLADGDRAGRHDRPGAGGGARRARPDARPLPAVVRARDRRRLGRDPLGRPGVDRLRPHRRARRGAARRDAEWGDRDAVSAGVGRRAAPARAARRLGGDARRDRRGHAARAPAAGGSSLRGVLAAAPAGGRRRLPRADPGRLRARRRAPVGPARDAGVARAVGRRRARHARAARLPARAGPWRRLPRRSPDGRTRARPRCGAGAQRPRACCASTERSRSARRSGARGSTAAFARRTCATSCSRTA